MTNGPAAPEPVAGPAPERRRPHRAVLSITWKTAAILLMLAGLLLITLRLSLPGISHYRADIERWMSSALSVPVSIGALRADWSGWTPVLRIEDVRMVQRDSAETVARFARASFSIDLAASLKRGELLPGDITLSGATLVAARRADGTITFTSEERDARAGAMEPSAVLPWLLRHRRLKLRDTTVVWKDLASEEAPLVFNNVELDARNDGERHQFEGTLSLPAGLGEQLQFAFDATGDIVTPAWSGEAYLRGEALQAASWAGLQRRLGVAVHAGSGDFELWTRWRHGRLQRADGLIGLRDLLLGGSSSDAAALSVAEASTNFSAWRTDTGFDVDLARLSLTTGSGTWPGNSLSASYAAAGTGRAPRLTGRLDYLRLDDLMPLLGERLPAALADAGRETSAALHDIAFAWSPEHEATVLTARVDDFTLPATGSLPGVQGLDGRLELAGRRGLIEMQDDALVLDYPSQLPEALAVQRASGRFSWTHGDEGWQVDAERVLLSNEDLAARLRGSVRFRTRDDSPFVRLVLQAQRGRLSALKRYLPQGLLPREVADWLRRGLPSGDILGGEVLLHGLIQEFPFDDARGRLQARLEVGGARLDYHPGWPALEDVHGFVSFDGRGMEIVADAGRVQQNDIVHARAVVADLGAARPLLTVSGRIVGTTEQAVAFLAASPLQADFAAAADAVQLAGGSELELDLAIPLSRADDTAVKVAGTLRLEQNSAVFHGLRSGLEDLGGSIEFTEDGFTSRSLQARYLGQRLQFDIRRNAGKRSTRIGLSGRADRDLLLAHFRNVGLPLAAETGPALLLDRSTGETDFEAALELPDRWPRGKENAALFFSSSLEGVTVSLPAPLGKRSQEQRPLRLRSTLHADGNRLLRFSYGRDLAGVFDVQAGEQGPRLRRGLLRLGVEGDDLPGLQQLPEAERVRLAGRVDALSLNEWYAALHEGNGEASEASAPVMLDRIAELDLQARSLRVLGYELREVHLQGERADDGSWQLRLDGPDLQGDASLPATARGKVAVRLDHLVLRTSAGDGEAAIDTSDPRGLPSIDFACSSLRYEQLALGEVVFATRAVDNGLSVERLSVANEAYSAAGRGAWLKEAGLPQAVSTFSVQLQGERLDQMLTALGYGGRVIEGGSTRVDLDASWSGAPSEASLERLRGTLRASTGPGRLLEVNPGATGRVFGLLTLGSLPKRLRLDFGDLFEGGLVFDRIEGKFALEGGNAYTNDLRIDGTAARIDIAGRTGLVNRDYDQLVTVTPRLASTLPLAGAVLGPAGAGVGAVIWLADKLFERSLVDQVIAYRYTITGSWDDPQVQPQQALPRQNEETQDRG